MENQLNNSQINLTPDVPPPETPPISPVSPTPKSGAGALIGSAIVIILLILGALYFWGEKLSAPQENSPENTVPASDPIVEKLNTQSSSDDLSSIEADLNATEFSNPSSELDGVEAEITQ